MPYPSIPLNPPPNSPQRRPIHNKAPNSHLKCQTSKVPSDRISPWYIHEVELGVIFIKSGDYLAGQEGERVEYTVGCVLVAAVLGSFIEGLFRLHHWGGIMILRC